MKKFAFINTEGEPKNIVTPSDESVFEVGKLYGDLVCQEVPIGISDEQIINHWYWKEGAQKIRPAKSNEYLVWNTISETWEDPRTLQDFKEAQWSIIKQARTNAEYAGFVWGGSVFDSDPVSQQRINGAVTLALIAKQANQPYTITWTLKDSTLRTLSADEMIAVGLALGTHVQTIFNKGQLLQQAVDAATTAEQVEAITW